MTSPRVFVLWFGGHDIPPIRQAGIAALEESGLDVLVIRDGDLKDWIVRDHPLVPAFHLLTPIQRSDYFRAYLMHHHGGAYSDIKPPRGSWLPGLARLSQDQQLWAVGYPIQRWALSHEGVAPLPRYQPFKPRWWRYRWMQLNHQRILGGSGYAFKPGTLLTQRWLHEVERRVSVLAPLLQQHPGMYAKERNGDVNDGLVSQYPVPWLHLAGDVLHPLAYRYRRHIATILPIPTTEGYQDDRPPLNSGPRDLLRTWPDAVD